MRAQLRGKRTKTHTHTCSIFRPLSLRQSQFRQYQMPDTRTRTHTRTYSHTPIKSLLSGVLRNLKPISCFAKKIFKKNSFCNRSLRCKFRERKKELQCNIFYNFTILPRFINDRINKLNLGLCKYRIYGTKTRLDRMVPLCHPIIALSSAK